MTLFSLFYVFLCTGNQGYLGFDFAQYTTEREVIDALGRVQYRGENSNMTGGMRLARERLIELKSRLSALFTSSANVGAPLSTTSQQAIPAISYHYWM